MDAKALKEITSQLNLLYVEDDKNLRIETAKLFGHLFDSVDLAENGKQGLEMFLEKKYDLIITDINMPLMGGVELCRKIREIDPEMTIIITSAHDESKYLIELIDIGIDKFILKPLDMQKLINTLLATCTNIVNAQLVLKYKQELEVSNHRLFKEHQQLKSL